MKVELTTAHHAPVTAKRMREAALRFLDSLDDGQRGVATFDFEGDERYEVELCPGHAQRPAPEGHDPGPARLGHGSDDQRTRRPRLRPGEADH